MKEFIFSKKANIGACMDVKAHAGRLYAIQNDSQFKGGRLVVLDENFNILHTFEGIGNARQIEFSNDIAIITCRENNMFLIDTSNGTPKLLSRYQTVEFATGIAICDGYAFVSIRQYGVEVIDIADAENPKFVSVIRTGAEIQSACVYDGILYCGAWGEMKVVTVDISNPAKPEIISNIQLNGRGDGVIVRDGILYAVTGQHRRGIKNSVDKSDPCFGNGNGLEIFDVKNPANPVKLCEHSFGYGHSTFFDMWQPILCGDKVVCSCSTLGIFVYNASGSFEPILKVKAPDNLPVTGITSTCGKLFASTGTGDLYCFDDFHFDDCYEHVGRLSHDIQPTLLTQNSDGKYSLRELYSGDFPVLKITEAGENLLLACGKAGAHLIRKSDLSLINTYETPDFCCDAAYQNGYIFLACEKSGLLIYSQSGELVSSYTKDLPVLQLEASESGDFVVCTVGGNDLIMLDVSDKASPCKVACEHSQLGLIYGENFFPNRFNDGSIGMFWHRAGLYKINPDKGDRKFTNVFYDRDFEFMGYCPGNGCTTDGDDLLFAFKKGYVILPVKDGVNADKLPVYQTSTVIPGKLCIAENMLISTERARGIIVLTDISNEKDPKHIAKITTSACCGKAVCIDGHIYIPATHSGLLEVVKG